tara:strand:- start:652 stop:936 length:285 start_codon:yes stop_codon:yes gene_type:complete
MLQEILTHLKLRFAGVIREQCPQQSDGSSCGVFVLYCIEEMMKIMKHPEKNFKSVKESAKFLLYPAPLKAVFDKAKFAWEPFPKGSKRSSSMAV